MAGRPEDTILATSPLLPNVLYALTDEPTILELSTVSMNLIMIDSSEQDFLGYFQVNLLFCIVTIRKAEAKQAARSYAKEIATFHDRPNSRVY